MVRYCMVLFAGIAAEALIYGEAEGGENDENFFRSICVLLEPPLSVAEVSLTYLLVCNLYDFPLMFLIYSFCFTYQIYIYTRFVI